MVYEVTAIISMIQGMWFWKEMLSCVPTTMLLPAKSRGYILWVLKAYSSSPVGWKCQLLSDFFLLIFPPM